MQVFPNRFNEELAKRIHPFYLLFGDEPQQKIEMIDAVREQSKRAGFEERTSFVADSDFEWSQLIEATQTLSLFASKQLIELELPTGKPGTEGSKTFAMLAEQVNDDVIIVVHGPRIGKDVQKAKWFKALDSVGVYSLCYPLEGNALTQWISQRCKLAKLNLDNTCIKRLADYCEGNLLAARQEIDKLSLLYQQDYITLELLDKALVDHSRFNVFQLIDVILSGDNHRCVKMLLRLESEGIEPNILIWALVREWQTLWSLNQLRDANQPIAWQKLGIWKNRQAFYQTALTRLNRKHLEIIREQLQQADLLFKQTTVNKPFVKLCHLCMLFLAVPVQQYEVAE
ncbi:DNA polymerase III subunit delta [Alteromonas sp. ASW11-130]|uniref:DNA polymerase III subunit delta n=1 Tax=Alteromonas sp. ASW11-130 TaxID=3015775 RepID=UPI0022418783|nr:DNA polymerase III subunit delta [Alteromonas sp. ASW11-130]MCW8092103.1 DNA polymerase III subunit delta [Alteromonas sp. ASW11-130]